MDLLLTHVELAHSSAQEWLLQIQQVIQSDAKQLAELLIAPEFDITDDFMLYHSVDNKLPTQVDFLLTLVELTNSSFQELLLYILKLI